MLTTKVKLIGPKYLFSEKKGVDEEFTRKEDNKKLRFANLSALGIYYGSRSNLAIDSASTAATMAP